MARYAALVGKRVAVQYRAGDIYLPATGTLAADSGKSIFLEERFEAGGRVQNFRWEIPYPYIVEIGEARNVAVSAGGMERAEDPLLQLPEPNCLPLKKRPQES
jgi:hypothetical protein